jgi:hypothetical protein
MGAYTWKRNVLQICEMLVYSIHHVRPLSMLAVCLQFALCNFFLLCRFEAQASQPEANITKLYAGFARAGMEVSSSTISASSLG